MIKKIFRYLKSLFISDSKIIEDFKNFNIKDIQKKGTLDFYNLRNKWSWHVIRWIWFLLIFQIVILFCIGKQILIFNNTSFLIVSTIEMCLEVIGMGVFIVQFLYKDPQNQNPNVIDINKNAKQNT
jgi:hypothetical protein